MITNEYKSRTHNPLLRYDIKRSHCDTAFLVIQSWDELDRGDHSPHVSTYNSCKYIRSGAAPYVGTAYGVFCA